jgi:nascent polypeptide-associated complex subunit alpha
MEKMMKQMGIKSDEIEAEEVLIKCKDRNIVIRNPQITKIGMHGQESLQIIGEMEDAPKEAKEVKFSEDDVKTVMEQTGKSEEEARSALEETKDIAQAIMKLKE